MRQLTVEQVWSVTLEAQSARQLLGHGCLTVLSDQPMDALFDPVATVWSIGVEKLLKLGLGLASISRGTPWPNGRQSSHNLESMDAQLRAHLMTWSGVESEWLRRLLQDIDGDETWMALVHLLGAYARSGRFAQLDRLANAPRPPSNPRPLWDEVEQSVLRARPELLPDLHRAPARDESRQNAAITAIRRSVATSLTMWWFAITRSAAHGAYGEGGRFLLEAEPRMALPVLPQAVLSRLGSGARSAAKGTR